MAVNSRFEELLSELSVGVEECHKPFTPSDEERNKILREIEELRRNRQVIEVNINKMREQTISYSMWDQLKEKADKLVTELTMVNSDLKRKTDLLKSRPRVVDEKRKILIPILSKFNLLLIEEFETFKQETLAKSKIDGENYLQHLGQVRQSLNTLVADLARLKSELEQLKVDDARYSQIQNKKSEIKECQCRISEMNNQNYDQQERDIKSMLEIIKRLSLTSSQFRSIYDLREKSKLPLIQEFLKTIDSDLEHNWSWTGKITKLRFGMTEFEYKAKINEVIRDSWYIGFENGFFGDRSYHSCKSYEMSGSGFGGRSVTSLSSRFTMY